MIQVALLLVGCAASHRPPEATPVGAVEVVLMWAPAAEYPRRVLVDGVERCPIPCSVDLAPGPHRIRLVLADGEPVEHAVEIAPVRSVVLALEPGGARELTPRH